MKSIVLILLTGCFFSPVFLAGQQTQHDASRLPDWGALGAATPGGPNAWPLTVAYGPDQLAVFWDKSSDIYVKRWQGGLWSNWESMGWTFGDDRAGLKVVSWSPGRMDAFTTVEGHLYHSYWQGGAWSPWDHRGGGNLEGSFEVVTWGPGRLDIFARTETGGLMHTWWENGWGTWEELRGQNGLRDYRAIKVVSWAPGRLDIFAVQENNSLDHLWYANGWGDWENLGGGIGHDFAVVCKAPGKIDIFAIGLDANIHRKFWNGSLWSNWSSLGIECKPRSALIALSRVPGKTELFLTDNSTAIQAFEWDDAAGSAEYWFLGGATSGGLSAASWGPRRLDVVVIGTDGQYYHMPWDGQTWGY
jgi:serine protease AprX